MPTIQGIDLQRYKDDGLMPGFFSWLEELGTPIDTVDELGVHRDITQVGVSEGGWKILEPSDETTIYVQLKDGTRQQKVFEAQELHEVK